MTWVNGDMFLYTEILTNLFSLLVERKAVTQPLFNYPKKPKVLPTVKVINLDFFLITTMIDNREELCHNLMKSLRLV